MHYTVKVVAELAGVSVRALHHYDHVGLLKPTDSSAAGYRLYTAPDLERLQQILFFKELGMGLGEIAQILDRPDFDRKAALLNHKAALLERRQRLDVLLGSLERTIESIEKGVPMDTKDMFEGFEDPYREEAEQRWGKERVAESYRRMGKVTKAEVEQWKADAQVFNAKLASLMDRGPADPEVQALVAEHHRIINERFYDCPPEVYRGLGDMYVDDARFTAFYDTKHPGLAAFLRQAMHVYADALEANG